MDRQLPLDPYILAEVNEPWRNREAGVKGHAVKHEAFTQSMEEIVHVIEQAGLTPTKEDLTQLWQALELLTNQIVSSVTNARGYVGARRVIFATPGAFTFTVPAEVYAVDAQVWAAGGGGGGAGSSSTLAAGSGGGSGSYSRKRIATTPGASLAGVVGAGGTGGSSGGGSGGNAGSSTFGGITCIGGSAGTGASNAIVLVAGLGGSTSGGDIGINGRSGQLGIPLGTTGAIGGFGAAAYCGAPTGPNTADGQTGSFPGGGGSGGAAYLGKTAGGPGGGGCIIISY
jgi:hypothetical protein